ncbi:Protoporphyrinogen oxidase [Trichodelitschia bisporula]|uniref:Protoporphyrinogen oxidase n=1 Tax=Trichodelitschia bisporula TaxID=703511 RepID=A0A6G1I274_9PEZI|nr:Protoporphyrinogen oxidase [Trichodelitschia bisporula]
MPPLLSPLPRVAPRALRLCLGRRYLSASAPGGDFAVIGGGITGLSTAWFLYQRSQTTDQKKHRTKITLFEAADRTGGWIQSKHVDVPGGRVLFETGARTLRPTPPGGRAVATLIEELGLKDDLIFGSKDSPAAIRRWLYNGKLVELPHPKLGLLDLGMKLFTQPALKGIISGVFSEPQVSPRPDNVTDESVGSFVTRRMNKAIANNLTSAVFHGIYAGDIWQLSARSLLPSLWHGEKEYGSLVLGSPAIRTLWEEKDEALQKRLFETDAPADLVLRHNMASSSVFTLRGGLEQLSRRLEEKLLQKGVTIRKGTPVTKLEPSEDKLRVKVFTKDSAEPQTFTNVIATCPAKTLSSMLTAPSGTPLVPLLSTIPAVTVNVINLWYPDPHLLPIRGFGSLIPQTTPLEDNPCWALGIVYDSEIVQGQDSVPGTKLTVMLGGHWWDGWSEIPGEEQSIRFAKETVARQLGITAEPAAVNFSSQKECIPQYTVGHTARMAQAHHGLKRTFGDGLSVAGSSYTGVGVNDCIKAAYNNVVWNMATGLEPFTVKAKYRSINMPNPWE